MKIKNTLIALPFLGLLLTGCVGKKTYEPNEYMIPVPWSGTEKFKILQLNDIHLSQSDVHEEHFKVIDRTVNEAKPNLIVLNGDIFTFADKHTVNKVFEHIDSYGILWTFTFGNHDDQGYYSDVYLQRLLASKKYTHSLFKNLEDDDVSGRSNFVLNIQDKDDNHKVIYQVFLLDSHNYNFDTIDYDYLKQDQINWYERIVKYSTANFSDGVHPIKSSMYMHIGFPEFIESWDEVKENENGTELLMGDMQEWGGSPEKDPGFFKKIKELGSTQSVSAAHDHSNDSVIKYRDVFLCYGVHSTDRIYNDNARLKIAGGQVIAIDKVTKALSFTNYYGNYEDGTIKTVVPKEVA